MWSDGAKPSRIGVRFHSKPPAVKDDLLALHEITGLILTPARISDKLDIPSRNARRSRDIKWDIRGYPPRVRHSSGTDSISE